MCSPQDMLGSWEVTKKLLGFVRAGFLQAGSHCINGVKALKANLSNAVCYLFSCLSSWHVGGHLFVPKIRNIE